MLILHLIGRSPILWLIRKSKRVNLLGDADFYFSVSPNGCIADVAACVGFVGWVLAAICSNALLNTFFMRIKYPRTYHLPFSEGTTNDDKILKDLTAFENQEVVVTEKMDGENTTMTRQYFYARSVDSNDHKSRHLVKGIWGNIRYLIPENWRICGENVFAKHSIHYTNLDSYFLVYSVWNEKNECLSFDETIIFCQNVGLCHVPVLWRGFFQESKIIEIKNGLNLDTQEGFVIRVSSSFNFDKFKTSVAKWVRKNHVQTSEHWMNQPIIRNLCSF